MITIFAFDLIFSKVYNESNIKFVVCIIFEIIFVCSGMMLYNNEVLILVVLIILLLILLFETIKKIDFNNF